MKQPKSQLGVGDIYLPPIAKVYVNDILKSRRITYGKYTQEFEKVFAHIHKLKFAIFTNSGTSALQVSVHILKKKYRWKDGDEVLVPAVGFVSTINVLILNKLKPVLVDVESDFFEIDTDDLLRKITKRTRAIIVVHLAGLPGPMEEILSIAKKYDLKIIEDSCETMFAKYHKRPVGSFGELSCFSTYAAHLITTGVGGLICTNDKTDALWARSLINHGRDPSYIAIDDDRKKNKKSLYKVVERRFSFVDIGYSFRATEFEAAIGLAQLETWRSIIRERIKNALYLKRGLSDLGNFLQLPKVRDGCDHVFMVFPIVLKADIRLEKLLFFLEENKVETRYLFPLVNQPVYKRLLGINPKDFPVANNLLKSGFYIGCHNGFSKKDLNYIIYKFHEFFKNV